MNDYEGIFPYAVDVGEDAFFVLSRLKKSGRSSTTKANKGRALSMRHELIHFLSHVEEEKTMIEVVASLNADAYESLLHHLQYTSPETQERWRELLNRLFRL